MFVYKLKKWNSYIESACKPSIKEAGIAFAIERKSDGKNSVSIDSNKAILHRINGDYTTSKNLSDFKYNHSISDYKSNSCSMLPANGSHLLAFEFESKERIVPKPIPWTPRNNQQFQQQSEQQAPPGKQQLFKKLEALTKQYNVECADRLFEKYEKIEPLIEFFNIELLKVMSVCIKN